MQSHVRGALAGVGTVCTTLCVAFVLAGCGLATDGLADDLSGPEGGALLEAAVDAIVSGDDASAPGNPDVTTPTADATSDAAPSPDAPADHGSPPGPDAPSSVCVGAVPSGWTIVAYEPSRGACPSGFGASHDEYSGATAGASACTCTCQVTTQPDCSSGMVSTSYGPGPGPGCPSPGEVITVKGGACTALMQGGNLSGNFAATPVPLSGGACMGSAHGDATQVTKQGVRYCDAPPSGAESVCEGTVPQGFSACIASSGDVACPAGPFTNKTLVADDETLACSTCTSCTVGGTCGSPQVTLFGDPQCSQKVAQLAATGACVPSDASGKNVVAVTYAAQTNATCEAAGTTASLSPQGPHTLCCR